jgi:hypothetical protein
VHGVATRSLLEIRSEALKWIALNNTGARLSKALWLYRCVHQPSPSGEKVGASVRLKKAVVKIAVETTS